MQLFWRFGLILLLIAGGLFTPVTTSASEINQKSLPQPQMSAVDFQPAFKIGIQPTNVLEMLYVDSDAQSRLGIPLTLKDTPAKNTDSNDSEYAPLVSQRFISFSQHDPLQSRPDYQLAFEFSVPPVPCFTVGYRVDMAPAVDWPLHIASPSNRLSAWKETNTLYRFSQSRLTS